MLFVQMVLKRESVDEESVTNAYTVPMAISDACRDCSHSLTPSGGPGINGVEP